MFLRIPSAKLAESGGAGLDTCRVSLIEMEECENDEEKAEVGGRRGEWICCDLRDRGPGMDDRALNDADKGDGRLGDDAKAVAGTGERAKPGDVPPVGPSGGGPIGSLSGDEAILWGGGDWIEEERADRMGTGDAADSNEEGPSGRGRKLPP